MRKDNMEKIFPQREKTVDMNIYFLYIRNIIYIVNEKTFPKGETIWLNI